jgi:hypothetical protein
MVIPHLVPPTFFLPKGYPLKYRVNTGSSNRNMRFGNTVLSQQGDALVAGVKPPRTSSFLKIRLFLTFSLGKILIGGFIE